MRSFSPRYLLLVGLVALSTAVPVAAAQENAATQTINVEDSRTGTGPCGFAVQRDMHGTVKITPTVDDAGNLVMSVDRVSLRGTLSNPANGKSVELRWVDQNGIVGFAVDGSTTSVAIALTGRFLRDYDDMGDAALGMNLPSNGAETLTFAAGEPSRDPWAHVCGLLA